MPEGRSKLRAADRTNLRSSTSSSRAGDMTARGRNNFTANRANLVFHTRRTRTKRMTVRRNALCTFLVTTGTRRSLYAFFRARGRRRLHVFAPIMTESGNFLLRFNDGVTTAAMDAFGFPRSRTRCRYRLIDNLEMPKSFDFPRLRFPTACAFGRLNAFFRTSRSFRLHVLAPIMPESGNFLLRLDDRITAAAMRAIRQTRLRTRRGNGGIGHESVTQCRHRS